MDAEELEGFSQTIEVNASVNGKVWRPRVIDDRLVLALAQKLSISDILARILAGRNVISEEADDFLQPTIKNLLPDPSHLLDMDKALDRIFLAIAKEEKIAIFADYDVDGACSASILVKFFAAIGKDVFVYVPDRISEGYGPNIEALKILKKDGSGLVITVDCGTTAFSPLKDAAAIGLDVIVVDHHVAEPVLPEAVAIINPNRLDEASGVKQLCAAGVTFLLVVGLARILRIKNWFGKKESEPDLLKLLDLVALATVADVVPLTGLNRALVRQGLVVLAQRKNIGIAALADIAGLDERPESWHLGFLLGPRINAGGRVGKAGLGVKLLTTEDRDVASSLAIRLDQLNAERQEIEAEVLKAALEEAELQSNLKNPAIILASENWHPGVIGIVAGRVKESYNVPACVIAIENGIGKGSGRSIPGVDLGSSIIAANQAGLLIGGGGHAMAAGFTISEERILDFRDFLLKHISAQVGGEDLTPNLKIDAALTPEGATVGLIESLDKVGPFGNGNPAPRFMFPMVVAKRAKVVGVNHIQCFIGAAEGGGWLKAIAFRAVGTKLGNILLDGTAGALHVAGQLNINAWQGQRRAQLVIEDIAVPSKNSV